MRILGTAITRRAPARGAERRDPQRPMVAGAEHEAVASSGSSGLRAGVGARS